MKRTRCQYENKEPSYHPISVIPLDVWPIILKFCALETYQRGDGIFSLACVSKQCLAISKHAITQGQDLYDELSNAEIISSLYLFPVRAFYILSERHFAKDRTVTSQRYRDTIKGLIIKHVLSSLIDRLLSSNVPIFNFSGMKVLMTTGFHIHHEDTKRWIQHSIKKYKDHPHAIYKTAMFVKKTLDIIICTPKPTKVTLTTPNYFSQIELRFIESDQVLRATHPTFETPGCYDFKL